MGRMEEAIRYLHEIEEATRAPLTREDVAAHFPEVDAGEVWEAFSNSVSTSGRPAGKCGRAWAVGA